MYFRPYLFLTVLSIYCVQVSASYSESIAKQAFAYQKISYCTSSVISYWTCGPDCENVPGISEVKVIEDTSWGT
jgi:hypothetical protein